MNRGMSDSNDADLDLGQQALLYVLGELADDQASAFEERLATDLAACEAVASATRFAMTLSAAAANEATVAAPVRTNAPRLRSRSWVALAGAATSAAAVLIAMWLSPTAVKTPQLARQDHSAAELVSLWRISSQAAAAETDDLDVEVGEPNLEVGVPNWLLTAVSLEQGAASSTDSSVSQED